jgi:hypothetical protein
MPWASPPCRLPPPSFSRLPSPCSPWRSLYSFGLASKGATQAIPPPRLTRRVQWAGSPMAHIASGLPTGAKRGTGEAELSRRVSTLPKAVRIAVLVNPAGAEADARSGGRLGPPPRRGYRHTWLDPRRSRRQSCDRDNPRRLRRGVRRHGRISLASVARPSGCPSSTWNARAMLKARGRISGFALFQ